MNHGAMAVEIVHYEGIAAKAPPSPPQRGERGFARP